MDDDVKKSGLSRRGMMALGGVAAGAGLLMGGAPAAAWAQAGPNVMGGRRRKLDPDAGLSVVLIGTGTPVPNPHRACACTMVVAGDRAVMVDAGRGSLDRLARAGFDDASLALFTHYHSDHFSDFGEFMVTRTIAGADRPMPVIGPAGANQVIGGLLSAYELDNGYRLAHHRHNWNLDGMRAEITEAEPGVVYDDGELSIEMFEVDHPPVKPAMGYRFDFRGQVAVISGDTRPTPIMVEMAKDADILVHEAYCRRLIQLAENRADDRGREMMVDVMDYHTDVLEAAQIAAEARAKKLVLTHLLPGLPSTPAMDRVFVQGVRRYYRGCLRVGRDGMEIKA